MPYRSKGPRLYLRRARRDKEGEHAAIWIIRDGTDQQSTGCAAHDIAGAERALAKYLASKHARAARQAGSRDPDQIPIADVLTLYLTDIVPRHSRPDETKGRIMALDRFFGDRMLSYVTGETCVPTPHNDQLMQQLVASWRTCARRSTITVAKSARQDRVCGPTGRTAAARSMADST